MIPVVVMYFYLFPYVRFAITVSVIPEIFFVSILISILKNFDHSKTAHVYCFFMWYIASIPLLLFLCTNILLYKEKNVLFHLLQDKRCFEMFLWPTWQIQFLVNITEGFLWPPWPFIFKRQLIAKRYFSLSEITLCVIWIVAFFAILVSTSYILRYTALTCGIKNNTITIEISVSCAIGYTVLLASLLLHLLDTSAVLCP